MNKYKGFWIGFKNGAWETLKIVVAVLLFVGGFTGIVGLLIWLSKILGEFITLIVLLFLVILACGIYTGAQQQRVWRDAKDRVEECKDTVESMRERVRNMEEKNKTHPNSYSFASIALAKEDILDAEYDLARAKERLINIEQFRNWR